MESTDAEMGFTEIQLRKSFFYTTAILGDTNFCYFDYWEYYYQITKLFKL